MIKGLERFRTYFHESNHQYVLIGGVAAMHWLEQAGLHPRATRDLDIVLVVESLDDRFLSRFWEFVRGGQYSNDYPDMLEIFSRRPPNVEIWGDPTIIPIPAGEDVSSLSAILLDDAYYAMVNENRRIEDGLSLLSPEGLILLKARAWLDLSRRKQEGERVDDRDIKKHRTGIFKLALLLQSNRSVSIPPSIRDDLQAFLGRFPENSPEWIPIRESSGLRERMPSPPAILDAINKCFRIE
jgi:hypothetical protein